MYREYFGLKELPFSIAPDPRYLYMSDKHREALAHLLYGINSNGGFVLLTGEVGTGKTTVCRCLLEQVPENSDIAFILNPKLSAEELLAAVCDELGVNYPEGTRSIKVFVDLINFYLLDAHARGRKTVVIIEEAQNLSTGVLEQVRLLTNLETNRQKLLQIIMLGQPELRDMLGRPEMRQLSQRITARYHLGKLSRKEVTAYVKHRLAVAGVHSRLFPPSTIRKLYRLSSGIPRLINLLCDRALLGTYVEEKGTVDRSTLAKASREVLGEQGTGWLRHKTLRWLSASLMIAVCGVAFAAAYYSRVARPVSSSFAKEIMIRQPASNTLRWPVDLPVSQSKGMAYRALFLQWNIPYQENVPPCRQAQTYGLDCLSGQGSLGMLTQLNRPAILKLFDGSGHEYYVTLTTVRGRKADVVVGKENRSVDMSEIETHWLGDYSLLWEMPPNYEGEVRPGARGPEVQWLDRQLALIQGRKTQERKRLPYDDVLVKQVKEFQTSKGLPPDGIVGPKTIIALNVAVGGVGPALNRSREEK